MNVEFAPLLPGSNDRWVMPVAGLVFNTVYGLPGEPRGSMVATVAEPPAHERYYRLSDGDDLIAMACLDTESPPDAPTEYELKYLAVDPAHQGEGYGSYMLQKVEREARSMGATALRLYPVKTAIPFYAKHGYTEHPYDDRYLWRALPAERRPVELPQPWRAPAERTVASVGESVARVISLLEHSRREITLAGDHDNAARSFLEEMFDSGSGGGGQARDIIAALILADEQHEAIRQKLEDAAVSLRAYRTAITGHTGSP